ncbi:NADPH-dependent FMN reductase [Deinococcus cellulosilyticus]|uniref:FMN reductase n=1 Tax=Deinococcus cellulosilyticus (strain DSM 18568 / NBRC 106333 / KACC 11606 / 5516J-15) TaxID=1223518 RepID=A0A511N2D9_DEIC1|nr:NADPH-dependent FMN reductase [Deinococcus cellulosilyticus]GEM47019.1 FMN reductase [Deinococcus cellulosilyticus NBRC 106333 = KACC 11606]
MSDDSSIQLSRPLNILAVSGSLRKASSNSLLVQAIQHLAPAGVAIEVWDDLDALPHFNPDLDVEDAPRIEAVQSWREKVKSADGVVLCTPEYAAGVPGSFKNALDWLVGSGDLADRPVAAISASPYPTAGEHAHTSLMLTLGMLGARVPEGAQLKIGLINRKISPQGEIIDPELKEALKKVLFVLAESVIGQPV